VEERYSFWADTPAEESKLYQQFLEVIDRHQDSWLYAYGSYEAAFLRRMSKETERPTPGDQLLARLVNVLSIIYAQSIFPPTPITSVCSRCEDLQTALGPRL
jgi:predicted RecB family nuclease